MVSDGGRHTILEANPMSGYDGYDRRLGPCISRSLTVDEASLASCCRRASLSWKRAAIAVWAAFSFFSRSVHSWVFAVRRFLMSAMAASRLASPGVALPWAAMWASHSAGTA